MTNEEAKKMLKAKLECFKNETSGINYDCNMRLCDGCSLNYEQGNMGEQKEALQMAIEALKAKSEIENSKSEIKNAKTEISMSKSKMTNEEAITILKREFSECKDTISVYAQKRKKAFDMAIKALEQRGCVWEIAYERGKVEAFDNIRAEILENRQWHIEHGQEDCAMLLDLEALAVIDKYRKGGAE